MKETGCLPVKAGSIPVTPAKFNVAVVEYKTPEDRSLRSRPGRVEVEVLPAAPELMAYSSSG